MMQNELSGQLTLRTMFDRDRVYTRDFNGDQGAIRQGAATAFPHRPLALSAGDCRVE